MRAVQPPASSDTWVGLTDCQLPIAAAYEWCVLPNCGAVVLFSGVVRDHAVDQDGVMRTDVQHLVYEAYESQAVVSFQRIADEVRVRWPVTGRIALLHRTGQLEGVGERFESGPVVALADNHEFRIGHSVGHARPQANQSVMPLVALCRIEASHDECIPASPRMLPVASRGHSEVTDPHVRGTELRIRLLETLDRPV